MGSLACRVPQVARLGIANEIKRVERRADRIHRETPTGIALKQVRFILAGVGELWLRS